MKREKGFKAPFAVMRQIGTSMEDQLVSGFARVIRSGMYANGTSLPGVRKLAVAFGVSEITIRNAVKRLCRDGLIAARPRVGLTVCAPGSRSWRGSVLGIKAGPPGMYFTGVLENSMSSVLRRNGWLYTSVEVSPRLKDEDVTMMEMLLDSFVRLVVLFEAPPQVVAHVAKSGVPFVEVPPTDASIVFVPDVPFIISSRRRATPLIVTEDSGDETLKLTSSAHVWISGKIRISTSLKVRSSRSLSAFAIVSDTIAT